MDKIILQADERAVLGKKVKLLRKDGVIPAHVYGKQVDTEHVAVKFKDFLPVFAEAGETGVIELKIGADKTRPVMIRGMQYDAVRGELLHIDFYQVDLKQKVTVPVPVTVVGGEDIESIKMGEAVILQPISEIEVEALPTDLIDNIEVNISTLKNIDDAITIGQLTYDRSKLTVLTDSEEVVVKLAPAVTEEMKKLLEEQAAEAAAAAATAAEGEEGVEGGEAGVEGAEGVEPSTDAQVEAGAEGAGVEGGAVSENSGEPKQGEKVEKS